MATHFAVTIYPAWCNNLARIGLYMRLVVTVDGLWEIPDSVLVTWYTRKCDVFGIKEMLYYTITSKKYLALAYFCEKLTLSENCNN